MNETFKKLLKAGKEYGRNGTPATELNKDGGYALTQRWP